MVSRARKDYRALVDYEDDGLTSRGRKNAQHAEDIHVEVENTRVVMATFLIAQLISAHPNDWQQECVEAAFASCECEEFRSLLPDHYDIANYDVRSLAVVMQYNLPMLVFERGATVTPGEVKAFVTTRNIYEHRDPRLNYRRWRNDIEMLRSFRAKMQSENDLAAESYTAESLPQMQEDAAAYLARLETLQHQIEAVTNTLIGLDKRLQDNVQADEAQSAELSRQQEADKEQFAELDRQRDTDKEHDRLISLLSERDARQHKEIISLIFISTLSLGASLVSLLRRR